MRGIGEKLANPHSERQLTDSRPAFEAINIEIDSVNDLVKAHNKRLAEREVVLRRLKAEFWRIVRWQYDQTISRYRQDASRASTKIGAVEDEISKLEAKIANVRDVISAAQKETVNIDQAIDAINAGLVDLGIDDISIVPYGENLYRVVRADELSDTFHTLSEGEKMIISFLYLL